MSNDAVNVESLRLWLEEVTKSLDQVFHQNNEHM